MADGLTRRLTRNEVASAAFLGEALADDPLQVSRQLLINLGYPKSQADKVVEATAKELTPEEPIEAWIRVALRRLAR